MPAVVSVDDVAGAVAALIARHESLRTTYLPGEQPCQRVAAAGVQLLEACSLGEGNGNRGTAPRWPRPSSRGCANHPIRTRPLRVAVAVAPGAGERVIACAAAFSHLAVDHGSIAILQRDFAGLLGDPARRAAVRSNPPGHQPLDQAELEATPAERRRAEAVLDYLREQLRRMPRCLYALPGARASGEALAVELSSVAAAMAVRQVAARTRTSRSSVVLAAIGAVIADRANYPELVLPLISSNRFERHLANYVGALAQATTATVEIAGRSFDELACHAWTTVMEASRTAGTTRSSGDAMAELTEHERGLRFHYDPLFNSLVPESWSARTAGTGFQPEEIDLALTRTELRWRPMPFSGTPIQFRLTRVDACRAGRVERRHRPAAAGRAGVGAAGRRAPAGGRRPRRRARRPDARGHRPGAASPAPPTGYWSTTAGWT